MTPIEEIKEKIADTEKKIAHLQSIVVGTQKRIDELNDGLRILKLRLLPPPPDNFADGRPGPAWIYAKP